MNAFINIRSVITSAHTNTIASFLYCSLVGCGRGLAPQLLGVCLSSMQSALGGATFLSLAARFESKWALTMWSSGTGFAGVFGYGYVYFLHALAGLSFRTTLLLANFISLGLALTFFKVRSYSLRLAAYLNDTYSMRM